MNDFIIVTIIKLYQCFHLKDLNIKCLFDLQEICQILFNTPALCVHVCACVCVCEMWEYLSSFIITHFLKVHVFNFYNGHQEIFREKLVHNNNYFLIVLIINTWLLNIICCGRMSTVVLGQMGKHSIDSDSVRWQTFE